MLYLTASVLLSSFLTLSFKQIERYRISNFQVIVFNYVACAVTAALMSGGIPLFSSFQQPWFKWALLIGIVFIILLNIIGITAQKINVAVASVANKLSLVVPFVFSIFLYNEKVTWLKITGVLVALAGVLLTSWPAKKQGQNRSSFPPFLKILLPSILFVGSGLLDTMMKYVQKSFLNAQSEASYLVCLFATSAAAGLLALPIFLYLKKEQFDKRSTIAGIIIGVPNYFSIWFLIKVLKEFNNNSTAIIPINNMGIVLVSTFSAWLIFKEKLSVLNWCGIGLSLAAIALIAFG